MKPEEHPSRVHLERATQTANQYRWPPRLARLLGKVSDFELAERAGINEATVAKERRRRGIPPFQARSPDVEWTEEMIALLGEATDVDVAAELGISEHSTRYKRQILGIPAYGPVRETPQARRAARFWTPSRVALLGTASDPEIARRLGISQYTVTDQRRKRRIPPFEPRAPKVVWTAARARLLGRIPDSQIAKKLGIAEGSVRLERTRRGIPPVRTAWKVLRKPELRKLLQLRTSEVVKRTGLSAKTVHQLRVELGVSSPTVWNRKALRDLGRVPDEELAQRLGLSLVTIRAKRLQRGIRFGPPRWTKEQDDLVRRLPIAEVMRRTGRTRAAVHFRRKLLGVCTRVHRRWTKEQDDLVRRLPVAEAVRRTGRSLKAVYHRREKLGV